MEIETNLTISPLIEGDQKDTTISWRSNSALTSAEPGGIQDDADYPAITIRLGATTVGLV